VSVVRFRWNGASPARGNGSGSRPCAIRFFSTSLVCAKLRPQEVEVLEDLLRRCADGLGVPIRDGAASPVR
jgi:hypothetical protein